MGKLFVILVAMFVALIIASVLAVTVVLVTRDQLM